jgi:hypothetical protein
MSTDAFGQTICTRQMSPSGMGKKTVRALFTVSALCINESGADGLTPVAPSHRVPAFGGPSNTPTAGTARRSLAMLVSHLHQCAG